jgi:hypothetical protein
MRRINGLKKLFELHPQRLNALKLVDILLADLQNCRCHIYGCIDDDDKILLATLFLRPDTLDYDQFDQRIDLQVCGPILRADCPPLTYALQGVHFGLSGRCSMLNNVCGVDLYLPRSYTGKVGDIANQKFSIAVDALLKS